MIRNLRSILFLLILAGLAFARTNTAAKDHSVLGPVLFWALLVGFVLLLVINWAQGAGMWRKKK